MRRQQIFVRFNFLLILASFKVLAITIAPVSHGLHVPQHINRRNLLNISGDAADNLYAVFFSG